MPRPLCVPSLAYRSILWVSTLAAASVPVSGLQAQIPWKPGKPSAFEREKQGQDKAAAENGSDAADGASSSSRSASKTVRLNFVASSWEKVLNKVAKESQLELVTDPDKSPEGLFSRRDWNAHTPAEAIRILNRELEPQGFRLSIKGKHLVLLETSNARLEYARQAFDADERAALEDPQADPSARRRKNGNIQLAGGSNEEEQESAPVRQRRNRPDIALVSGAQDPNPGNSEPTAAQAANGAAAPAAVPNRQVTISLQHRDAVDVSRMIYDAFRPWAELRDRGPQGLQSFRVKAGATASKGTPLPFDDFEIGIDTENNTLVVEGAPNTVDAVERLVTSLDISGVNRKQSVRAVVTRKPTAQLASLLQPNIDRIVQEGNKADQNDVPNPPEAGATPENELPELLGGLKSDVSVEALSDLGVLILRGNQKDVEAVMAIIRQIEELSVGSAPELQLLLLRHVDSQALSELLLDVYSQLSTLRLRTTQQSQAVSIFPIARPNAILILSAANDLPAVIDLAEKLDQPVDPATDLKVIRLKHAVATQVEEMLIQMYPATETGNNTNNSGRSALTPRPIFVADLRSNSIVVQARPRDLNEIIGAIKEIDTGDSAAVAQMKFIKLKSASAEDVVETIRTAINSVLQPAPQITTGQQATGGFGAGAGGAAAGQAPAQVREVRSQVLQFLSADGKTALQSGVLADIRVSPDVRTNSVILTAPEQSMPLLEEIVRQLDRPAATVAEIKVFSLTNADATSMQRLLESLFGSSATGQGAGGQGGGTTLQQQLGLAVAGADDPSSSIVPLRFSVETRTNSIVAAGGAEALRVVEALLVRMDDSEVRQRQSIVYRLKNSPAADIATAVNQFLQTRRQIDQSQEGFVSPFEQLEREVAVVPEPTTNSLLISATPRFFEEIKNYVIRLDESPRQVVIQALIVEVLLSNTDELGVEFGFQDSVLFSRGLPGTPTVITQTSNVPGVGQVQNQQVLGLPITPGYNFNNVATGNNGAAGVNRSSIGPQSLSNFSLGRVNGDLGYGGLVLSAGSESVSLLLRALAARRHVDILSRPQIRTLDNQLASIQVGQEVPRANGVTVNQQTGIGTPTIQQTQVGIILEVTPRISPDFQVIMEVQATKSALSGQTVPIQFNPNNTTVNSPIIDVTRARTVVSVPNGQTIVLGGMITNQDNNESRKVPFLGDVPLLGAAFRYDLQTNRRTELLIFLTPRVVRSDTEAEMLKQIEIERINFVEELAERIHGPILGASGEQNAFQPFEANVPGAPGVENPPLQPVVPGTEAPMKDSPPEFRSTGFPPENFDDSSVPRTMMTAPQQATENPPLVPVTPEGQANRSGSTRLNGRSRNTGKGRIQQAGAKVQKK